MLQDTSWLDVYLSEVPHIIYQVDDVENTQGAQHATVANKGNEAMAYLQFIIDYYDRLPPTIAFIHGDRYKYAHSALLAIPSLLLAVIAASKTAMLESLHSGAHAASWCI